MPTAMDDLSLNIHFRFYFLGRLGINGETVTKNLKYFKYIIIYYTKYEL